MEVAYAKPEAQCLLTLSVPAGATVQTVIEQSGLLTRYPEIDLSVNRVGVFSQICELDRIVRAQERVEIYRALQQDPKDARRLRASKR